MDRPIVDGNLSQSLFYGSTGCQGVAKLFYGTSDLSKLLTVGLAQSE